MTRDPQNARILEVGDWHQAEVPMRWGDADALNHMNNTVYFRMMEEARIHMLHGQDWSPPAGQGFILAHASCDFLRPFTYPVSVRVTHRITRIGRSSLDADVVLDKAGDDAGPYARGRTVLVWMDYATNRSQPWSPGVLEQLGRQCMPAAQAAKIGSNQ
ncbi:acyl-CoA thioesterase [Bordetella sp. BOR01]|uniref:acyl-CoA thioesterase n=1 Tax=Bordetella sp. BOR01 TaxID=2854779 RepID=UPI00351D9A83